ncbi:MAG: DnaB-like helicase N-terminal domain-containing protein [bacterium]|nr:DnaB-like helicase N-terminal domain-containing protein [bacterium]
MSNNLLTEKLTSLQVERHFLSSLVKFPDILYEVDSFLKSEDFANNLHSIIFSVARQEILAGNTFDKVLLAQKIKSLNITTRDDINPFDYISNLYDSQINKNGGINSAKELCKLRIRRQIFQDAQEVQSFITGPKCAEKTVAEIVSEVDGIYNKRIMTFETEDGPKDVFEDFDRIIDEKAANPQEAGLITPYKNFNRLFGAIRLGKSLYSICSRPEHGKSTFLWSMGVGVALLNEGTKILYLDTELDEETTIFRSASAFSDLNMYYYETGKWVFNKDMVEKRELARQQASKLKGKIKHLYVPNKNASQLASIIKKWYYNEVGRGNNKGMVIYDYLKLTNDRVSNNWSEHQILADKINILNEVGNKLGINIFTSAQLNRYGEDAEVDNSSAVAGTDKLQWFSSFNAIFRRKTLDEVVSDGPQFGSHKLIPLKRRFQGQDAPGHFDLVKIIDDHGKTKFKSNFINFKVHNFKVDECGTLRDVIEHQNFTKSLESKEENSDTNVDL